MLSVVILGAVLLSVVILGAILLRVVTPFFYITNELVITRQQKISLRSRTVANPIKLFTAVIYGLL